MKPNKIAQTKHSIASFIKTRWSPRSFDHSTIEEHQILTIIEAGSWAPSAGNSQPWEFKYGLKGEIGFENLLNCLNPGNQLWAKNASALVLSIGLKTNPLDEKPYAYFQHDLGLANGYMLLQAQELGIHAHIMAGFDKAKTKELLGLEDYKEPICVIAFGIQADAELLEEPFQTRELTERTRKPLSEIAEKI